MSLTGLYAQSLTQEFRIRFDSLHPDSLRVEQIIRSTNGFPDTLWLYNPLQSYSDKHSRLAGAIASRYRLDFHFSSARQRGFIRVDSLLSLPVSLSERAEYLRIAGLKGRRIIRLYYSLKLPDSRFTGMGYRRGQYNLWEWLPLPVMRSQTLFYPNLGTGDYPCQAVPTRWVITGLPRSLFVAANAPLQSSGDSLIIRRTDEKLRLAVRSRPFRKFAGHGQILLLDPDLLGDMSDVELALAWDRITGFLEDFPGEVYVLVTRADWHNFPVYDVNWLPVIRGFPGDFRMQTGLLYQAVRQGMNSLQIDQRRDYGFWSGLAQMFVARYVQTYYPQIRMTGLPFDGRIAGAYRMFSLPYNHKYYLLYRYIASMNYDQALDLPADRLSNYNRSVGTPSKSFLTWHYLENMAGEDFTRSVGMELLTSARRQPVGPYSFDSLWHKRNGPGIRWLWGDYYHTARKPDFSVRLLKGDTARVLIRNRGRVAFPVSLHYADTVVSLPPLKTDTMIPVPENVRRFRLNDTPLYPEIHWSDNTAPVTARPLRIRFFKDLDHPFRTSIYVNPKVDYNLYDGLLPGVGLNNKGFMDKAFTWEISPQYGLRSKDLTGSVQFQYLKRWVRPYLFGWSVGGYFKRYHYDYGRWYRTASLFSVLSFKDRPHRFLKGADFTAEILYVNRQQPRPDETSSYLIGRVEHQWYRRGLLHNYRWKNSVEVHRLFVKLQTEFRFRTFVDKYRQVEWRTYAGWMPYNRTRTDFYSFALSRPNDYTFKYQYYGRSETTGLFHLQYVYAEGAFKVFYPDQFASKWMWVNNINLGLYKRLNAFADLGWAARRGRAPVFHYDAGLRYYLVPDYFEFYFPLVSDRGPIRVDKNYWKYIRIMFVFDLPGLFKMFSRSWY